MKYRHFEAERVGIFVTNLSRHGSVASIYDKAVNILMEKGLLLSLVASLEQMSAMSIQLTKLFKEDSSPSGERRFDLNEGTKASLGAKCFVVKDLIIDFSRARPWSGELGPRDYQAFSISRIELLEEALLSYGKEGGLLDILDSARAVNPYAAAAMRVLRSVSGSGNSVEKRRSILGGLSGLVGLGPGFTPSGDDFLSGVLLGEHILSAAQRRAHSATIEGECTRVLCPQRPEFQSKLDSTNSGGKTLLWQALKGHFPYYLLEAARGISTSNNSDEMGNTVERAVAHGETSGTDALVGLCWFFKNAFGV
jgi:hypothetical protein